MRKDRAMRDLEKYIVEQEKREKRFAAGYAEGYEQFKVGVMLWQAREATGLTQEKPILLFIKI